MVDHLVLATPDLAATVAEIGRLTGIDPVPGGRHPGLGTVNHLLGIGEGAYLEIIGPDPDQPAPSRPRPFEIDSLTESRLVTWSIQVEDIDEAVESSRDEGYDPGTPWAMSRRMPEGGDLRWRLTLDYEHGHRGLIPFLIDWGRTPHPSAGLPVAPLVSLEAVHPEPAAIEPCLKTIGASLQIKPGNRQSLVATLLGETDLVVIH